MDLDALKWLAQQSGGALVAVAALYLYHTAFLRERRHVADERDRLEKREDRIINVLERNAAALERLVSAVDPLADLVAAKVEHNLRGVIHAAILQRAAEDKR